MEAALQCVPLESLNNSISKNDCGSCAHMSLIGMFLMWQMRQEDTAMVPSRLLSGLTSQLFKGNIFDFSKEAKCFLSTC